MLQKSGIRAYCPPTTDHLDPARSAETHATNKDGIRAFGKSGLEEGVRKCLRLFLDREGELLLHPIDKSRT